MTAPHGDSKRLQDMSLRRPLHPGDTGMPVAVEPGG